MRFWPIKSRTETSYVFPPPGWKSRGYTYEIWEDLRWGVWAGRLYSDSKVVFRTTGMSKKKVCSYLIKEVHIRDRMEDSFVSGDL